MKIDITKPQPCPACGEKVGIKFYRTKAPQHFCPNKECWLYGVPCGTRELNRLSLLARLGEANVWGVYVWELDWNKITEADDIYRESQCEREAIITALQELEAQ